MSSSVAFDKVNAYLFWKGSNKFYCGGKVMMGPDNHRFVITFMLINIPILLFYFFPAVYFIDSAIGVWIFPICILLQMSSSFFLIRSAFMNPGYIHKQEPPLALGPINALPFPAFFHGEGVNRDVPVRGTLLKLKYCNTCFVFRPPRCSHCPD